MKQIRLSEFTSLADIAAWLAPSPSGADPDSGFKFVVARSSGFAPGAEGVALGALSELRAHGDIQTELTVAASEASKFFESLFGVALSLASRSVTSPTSRNDDPSDALWKSVVEGRGLIGRGNRVGIVFRDPDYSLPQCFREASGRFPLRDRFRAELQKTVQRMGFGRTFSTAEEDVITFLYEATQNSNEHARIGLEKRAVAGVRGIALERVSINSEAALVARTDLEDFQRAYCQRILVRGNRSAFFYSFTVADLGPGIQNTLPQYENETGRARLNRAFIAGATRKQPTEGLETGLGLAKLRSSAQRLSALLFVKSGALSGYLDFSEQLDPQQDLVALSDDQNAMGTSLTLMWPAHPTGTDQGELAL